MKNTLYGSLIMKVIFTLENDTSHNGRRAAILSLLMHDK
jgi:hypothetical protein